MLLSPERIEKHLIKVTDQLKEDPNKSKQSEGLKPGQLEIRNQSEQQKNVEAKQKEEKLVDLVTSPDWVKKSNKRNALITKVSKYLANTVGWDRFNVYFCGNEVRNDLLYKISKLWVDKNSRLEIIQEVHDQLAVRHVRTRKTILIIQQHYFWPKMKKDVKQYIRNWHVWKRSKASRNCYNGTLKPLPMPEWPWTDIILDFVTSLPECELKNAILIIVDCLAKKQVYIPCSDKNNKINAKITAKMLLHNVWRKHELPLSVVSD